MSFEGMLLPLMSEIKYQNYLNMVTVHGNLGRKCTLSLHLVKKLLNTAS